MSAIFEIEADKLFDNYYRFLAYPYTAKLKEVRKEKKLTQRDFGELIGVITTTIKRWEYGKHTVTRDMWERFKSMRLL